MSEFKPMLALDHSKAGYVRFPVLCSPKIDGFRAVHPGELLSRSLKRIPSPHVNALFNNSRFAGFDGEMCVGPPNASDLINRCGELNRIDPEATPDVRWYVFDLIPCSRGITPSTPYRERLAMLHVIVDALVWELRDLGLREYFLDDEMQNPRIKVWAHREITDEEQLRSMEQNVLELGYEGLMLRQPEGAYKFGRSGKTKPDLIKMKRFVDGEGLIVDIEPAMHNTNEAKRNALGKLERSTAQAGLVPMEMVGRYRVRLPDGRECYVGPGKMSHKEREEVWANRADYIGKRWIKFKHFEHGAKDLPRHALWIDWRYDFDNPHI